MARVARLLPTGPTEYLQPYYRKQQPLNLQPLPMPTVDPVGPHVGFSDAEHVFTRQYTQYTISCEFIPLVLAR